MQQRCLILVDGSNFYFKLKELHATSLAFDFESFGAYIAQSHKLTEARYYVGKIRQNGTKITEKLFTKQQKLIHQLKRAHWKYVFGFLMKSDGVYHEKGVDVQIAVDILVATYENLCDRLIIISSDTDLLPAIKIAKDKGKIVEYIGFLHKPSIELIKRCSEYRLLKRKIYLNLSSNSTR